MRQKRLSRLRCHIATLLTQQVGWADKLNIKLGEWKKQLLGLSAQPTALGAFSGDIHRAPISDTATQSGMLQKITPSICLLNGKKG
jgi:hypothetical protein